MQLVYRPRIIAHLGCAMILLSLDLNDSGSTGLWPLMTFSLIYPHVLHLAGRNRHMGTPALVRLQYVDALYGGLFCGAIHLAPLPATSILTALTMSNLVLFGPVICLRGWLVSGLGLAAFSVCQDLRFEPDVSVATNAFAALLILIYSWIVATLVYDKARDSAFNQRLVAGRNQQLQGMTRQLGKYISPQVLNLLSQQEELSGVRTSRKQLTLFFSDIEGFTELTDFMEPEALTELLNQYFAEMSRIVLDHGGTIDKFIGDGLMVFFGDPVSRGIQTDALRCIEMAIAMRQRMEELRLQWEDKGISHPLHIRMGIHTGFCTVGNIGCDSRLDYTAIGSSVNLASRLESLAGRDGIVISRETYLLVRDRVECEKRCGLVIKGFSRLLDAYSLNRLRSGVQPVFAEEVTGLRIRLNPGLVNPEQACQLLDRTLQQVHGLRRAGRLQTGESENSD